MINYINGNCNTDNNEVNDNDNGDNHGRAIIIFAWCN